MSGKVYPRTFTIHEVVLMNCGVDIRKYPAEIPVNSNITELPQTTPANMTLPFVSNGNSMMQQLAYPSEMKSEAPLLPSMGNMSFPPMMSLPSVNPQMSSGNMSFPSNYSSTFSSGLSTTDNGFSTEDDDDDDDDNM